MNYARITESKVNEYDIGSITLRDLRQFFHEQIPEGLQDPVFASCYLLICEHERGHLPVPSLKQQLKCIFADPSGLLLKFIRILEWFERDNCVISSTTQRLNHPAFKELVSLGEPIVPYLILYLNDTYLGEAASALYLITNQDPVPHEHYGNRPLIAQHWKSWALKNGILKESDFGELPWNTSSLSSWPPSPSSSSSL